MKLHDLKPAPGAKHRRKRVGRGNSSGTGKTSGRGQKGQKARGSVPPWFEGGQMPIQRRLPKRGFKNPGRVEYQIVKVGALAAAPAQATVNAAWLREQRFVRRPGPIKLLAGGDLKVALTVQVDAASASAKQAVETAGGTLQLPAPKPDLRTKRARKNRVAAKAKPEGGSKSEGTTTNA